MNKSKGVILVGIGSRIYFLTKTVNKYLLPVYDKPMIYYPMETLINAGIKEIMTVSDRGHAGYFLELLGSGEDHRLHFTYEIQEKAGGIAQALYLARNFVDGDSVTVLLGDNIFQDNIKDDINSFKNEANILLKEVTDAQRFGTAELRGEKK